MNSTIKNVLIGVAVIGVLLLAYFFLFKKGPEEAVLTSSTDGATSSSLTSETSRDFISLLLSVRSIKLNDSILNEPAFLSLKDTTITIIQNEDEGRPNPFAPIGSEAISSSVSSSSSSVNNLGNGTLPVKDQKSTDKKSSSTPTSKSATSSSSNNNSTPNTNTGSNSSPDPILDFTDPVDIGENPFQDLESNL